MGGRGKWPVLTGACSRLVAVLIRGKWPVSFAALGVAPFSV